MGISEQPSRSKLLLWLMGFVVVFGAVSWLVTGGIRLHVAPPTHSHPSAVIPGATPAPLVCRSNELEVVGVFNECAAAAPDKTSICSLSGNMLDALLRFAGNNQVFGLDVEVDGAFAGAGMYDLPPWPHGLGTKDGVPKVAVDEYSTNTLWQSVAGVLTVTSGDGRSGTLNAILQASNGTTVVPGPTLSVIGPWSCP
jgi:hypothetical protein